jgi:hypothetical protein
MPIGRAGGLPAIFCVILPSNFRTGSKNRCLKWGVPILDAPEGRRDDFVAPYFRHAKIFGLSVLKFPFSEVTPSPQSGFLKCPKLRYVPYELFGPVGFWCSRLNGLD